MLTLARPCVALICWLLTLPAYSADADARALLERMSEALANRNYDGRFFHVRGSRSETMRIVHRFADGKVMERLVSLDGSGREITRTDAEVICYLPDKRVVLVEDRKEGKSLLTALPRYSEGLDQHYSLVAAHSSRILGRQTTLLLVKPRDQFRYGYRLWLDGETAMPLKSQLCDHDGNVVEQIVFAQLELRDQIPEAELRATVKPDGYTWLRQEVRRRVVSSEGLGWSVARLPAGFKLSVTRVQSMPGSDSPVRHMVYSDGLASVSVFIEPRPAGERPVIGLTKLGSAFVYASELDGHHVTAVGEVPAATVEIMATSVVRNQAQPR